MTKRNCYWFGHNFQPGKSGKLPNGEYLPPEEAICSCGRRNRIRWYTSFEQLVRKEKWTGTFWKSDAFGRIKIFLWVLFWIAVFIFCIWLLLILPQQIGCGTYRTQFGVETVYNLWTGCMANSPKFGWIPVDEYFRSINLNIP